MMVGLQLLKSLSTGLNSSISESVLLEALDHMRASVFK